MRRIVSGIVLLAFLCVLPHEGMAAKKKSSGTDANAKYASIVVDAESGAVLSEKNANKPLHPASLTKMMTLLLLFEAMENGNVRLNDKITISQHAASQQPSKIGLTPGSTIRVEDAILAVVTKSANDISAAIAEHIAGSEERFALRMTRRARDIGMSNTTFKNAHGLHNPGQVTTARDMAILARYILVRYPNYYRYFGTKQFVYRGKTYTNHNRLMQTYPGMDGFKTGFINASGFNLVASAKRGGKRLIGVVFGGRSWKSRNDHMASLLDAGFSKSGDVRYASASAPVKTAVAPPPPVPAQKPVLTARPAPANDNFTSLSSLESGRTLAVAQQQALQVPAMVLPPAQPKPDVTEQAVANVRQALNRGDYSELTGEGDYDAATTRRVETGLIAAAVYKGEHEKVRQMQQQQQQAAPAPAPRIASTAPAAGLQPQHVLRAPPGVTPVAVAPAVPSAVPSALPTSNMWSIQIGAYTSRVATDDALRLAHSRLPADLTHASPIVVPMTTSEGLLFRARLGGFTQAQASQACRYFRDCLPVAPR